MSNETIDLFWFLPTSGDGRYIGSDFGQRPVDFGYPREIAVAADRLGFKGVRDFRDTTRRIPGE